VTHFTAILPALCYSEKNMSIMLKELYDALKEAGASEEKASAAAMAASAYPLNRGNLATKEDIARLERVTKEDTAALKSDIASLDKRLAVVEATLNRVDRLQWILVAGMVALLARAFGVF
jgi:hypothetical protein